MLKYSITIFFTTKKLSVSQFLGFYVSKTHRFAKLTNEVLVFFSRYGTLCGYESQLLGASDDVCLPNIASFHFSVSVGLALSSICTVIVKREEKIYTLKYLIIAKYGISARADFRIRKACHIAKPHTALCLLVWQICAFY